MNESTEFVHYLHEVSWSLRSAHRSDIHHCPRPISISVTPCAHSLTPNTWVSLHSMPKTPLIMTFVFLMLSQRN